jgi:UDP-N-acetylmuramoyl-tripeptide--D-alanyl-D-alanine ligase
MWTADIWLSLAVLAAVQTHLVWRRLLAYLRYFQQEAYASGRFLRWAGVRSLTDPAFWGSVANAWLSIRRPFIAAALFVVAAWVLAVAQPDPRRSGKIPLKLTPRATRVVTTAVLMASAVWAAFVLLWSSSPILAGFIASAVVFATAPLVLVVANLCLQPYEARVQRTYEQDAHLRVLRIDPVIIGITGSYGKSSSKAMLAHILQYEAPTLAASGSINTLMGLTRHIREELVFGHRFMVVEMGAFNTGSIKRLCQLTPPSAGLITAVGDMHLERFGSIDAIVRAKAELAEALPPDGLLVANADSPGALRIARATTGRRVLLYGETSTESLETRLEDVRFSSKGTSFVLRTREREHACVTALLGRPIVLNITGAFTLAAALGVEPELIVAAIRTLKPVSNRLEVVEENGVTWIRDAYNSNQFGFRAVLEVAAALPAVRRFLVTPGVVELGSDQFAVNRQLSSEAAAVCDVTIVVADANKEAFAAGHAERARKEAQLVSVTGRTEAFQWLRETVKPGDLVILENDLPDVYERSTRVFWGRDHSLQPTSAPA